MLRTNLCLSLLFGVVVLTGCGSDSSSFSILPDEETFYQNTESVSAKIDVVWVIDNSGSMYTSQTNLSDNINEFIEGFSSRNFDFRLAVTASDAYLALPAWLSFYNNATRKARYYFNMAQEEVARFRDSNPPGANGVYFLTQDSPDILNAFRTRAMVGTNGHGDERPLQSMRTALESSLNAGFHRSDAFLAVILVTDEDDFAHDGTNAIQNVNDPALHPVNSYVSFLDSFTGSDPAARKYSVSTISVKDEACRTALSGDIRKIGVRVNQLAAATGGVIGNLCGDFASELRLISDRIIELSTQFYLNRLPIVESIRVSINDVVVPQATDSSDGWTFNATSMSLIFSGAYVPPSGARIQVSFDPAGLQL